MLTWSVPDHRITITGKRGDQPFDDAISRSTKSSLEGLQDDQPALHDTVAEIERPRL